MNAPESPRRSAVGEITARLRAAILGGEYLAGTDLPGERELSRQLGVSRLTLRAGLSHLEAEGLVRAVHGSGTRVLDFRESGGVELMGHLVALGAGGAGSLALLADLLELRRVIAVEAVGLAASRATPEEIAALRAHVDAQSLLVDEPSRWVAADLALARMFARVAHNVALVLVANTLVRMLERQPGVELAFTADPRGALVFYRRVLALVEARDAERARALTHRLIARLDRRVLASLHAHFATYAHPTESP